MKPARGFTLLELLVVLGIAATLFAVTPPLIMAAMPGVELKGSARELMAALRYARGRAVAEQHDAALTLDLEAKKFSVTGRSRDYSIPEETEISVVAARSQQTDEHTVAFRFYPDGSSSGGRISLARGEREYEIDIDWLTGRIRIME